MGGFMKNIFSGKALVVVVLALTVSIISQINAVSSQTNKTLAWQVAESPSPTGTKTSSPTSTQTPTPRIAPIICFYMPLIYK
jgi:hypothetical protein